MEISKSEQLNPWVLIWVKPRKTIRFIIDNELQEQVIPLAILSGMFQLLDNLIDNGFGNEFNLLTLILIVLIGGPIAGIITLYISAEILTRCAHLFGGVAQTDQMRVALAWSTVPNALNLFLFIPVLLIFGSSWFSESGPQSVLIPEIFTGIITFLFVILTIVLLIWSSFLRCFTIAEINRFSFWKGLLTLIMPIVIIGIPFALVFVFLS